jgi:hypothetical protein
MKKIILMTVLAIAIVAGITATVSAQDSTTKTDVVKVEFTCPMHPEVLSDKPGQCPKCGMDLVKKEPVKVEYTCPMHPEVISDKPGKCPKCGMDLVIKGKEAKKKGMMMKGCGMKGM